MRPVATSQPTSRPAQPRQPPRAVDGPGPGHGRRWMLSHTLTRTHAHTLHTCTHKTRRGSETSNDETARNSIGPSQQSAGKHPRASARAPQTARRTRASYPVHVIRARAIAGARARVGFLRVFRRTEAPVSSLRKTRDSLIVVQSFSACEYHHIGTQSRRRYERHMTGHTITAA